MKIHFSTTFGFDNTYPRINAEVGEYEIGQLRLGMRGLLEYLENHLGLYQKNTNDIVRLRAYENAIKRALEDHPSLYIAKSFNVDSWGAASQLLEWRDELVLAMYDFDNDDPKTSSKRLFTLSIIEGYNDNVPNGINDRWINLLNYILLIEHLPLEKICIYEPKNFIHPFFPHLFSILESKGVVVEWIETKYAPNDSDLGKFQDKLLDTSKTSFKASKDGSLLIVQATNDILLSECIGEVLNQMSEKEPLIIIPDRGRILEGSIINRGLPAIGSIASDADGAIEQLLHIITVFLWEPINPHKLVQLLSHPIAPMPRRLRSKLAMTFSRKSSIKSDLWNETIDSYLEDYKDNASKIKKGIDLWFNRDRCDARVGAEVNHIKSLYQDLMKWAQKLSSVSTVEATKNALHKLTHQCSQLIHLVNEFSEESEIISESQLNKWIEKLDLKSGTQDHDIEVGSFPCITKPANITATSECTIWWNFLDTMNPVKHATSWTKAECEILEGKYIHTKENIINQWFWEQCRPILMTSSKLIVCIPETVQGRVTEVHPLYYDLKQAFSNVDDLVYQIGLEENIEIDGFKIQSKEYAEKNLPQVSTHWNIDTKGKLNRREFESYSSLTKLFYYPHDYLLNYHLNIRPDPIPDISISSRLFGLLVHSAVHHLWDDPDILVYDDLKIDQKIKEGLVKTIKEEGTVLLLPENELSLLQFQGTAQKSIRYFIDEIKANNWTFLESEERHEVSDEIGLLGDIDLVLKRGKDDLVIIDLKWGGLSGKIDELINEQELQLIIYNKLLSKAAPNIFLCYYIISSQTFLSRNNDAFKETRVIASTKELNVHNKGLWDKMINTYTQRCKELDEGIVEVGLGLPTGSLKDVSAIWSDETNAMLKGPNVSGKKKEDKYSNYNKIVGEI